MAWKKWVAGSAGVWLAGVAVVAIIGPIDQKATKSIASAPASYELHKDPEYIAMVRREAVKLSGMKWRLGGFQTVMIASFDLTNSSKSPIKDVAVKCDITASSGTNLATPTKTVYRSIFPGETVKISELSMGFVRNAEQAANAVCYVDGHSDG